MVMWKCEKCGETYYANPDHCSRCGHTVLKQYHPSDDASGRRNTILKCVLIVGLLVGFYGFLIAGTVGTGYSWADEPAENFISGAVNVTSPAVQWVQNGRSLNKTKMRLAIHGEINERRVKHGLDPIELDFELSTVAAYHSNDMANNSYYSHTFPSGETMEDRYAMFGYRCRVPSGGNSYLTGAENIFYSTESSNREQQFAEAVVDAWMDSPGHRKNILNPHWTAEGIGVAKGEYDGHDVTFVTQNFC